MGATLQEPRGLGSFTIVVPTRDDPPRCAQMLEALVAERESGLDLRVVFLVNDTGEVAGGLEEAISDGRFSPLRPRVLYAPGNLLTVEENILHTLGQNLDAVGEHFLIIGNSDRVDVGVLRKAWEYLQEHRLDLLLVAWLNREVYEGKVVRQLSLTPRHLSIRNRLVTGRSKGCETFANALTDYGPEGHLAYIGCQIYTKPFFRAMCAVLAKLPEPLYGIPVATLEVTTRREWTVGFSPDIVVVRIDHLLYGPESAEQPQNWWIPLSRTRRGLSRHCVVSIISNSLHLSHEAFETLVNCQMVCNQRATPCLVFTNFLFTFVEQMRNISQNCPDAAEWHYSPGELRDIVGFGKRLGESDIGLAGEQRHAISAWFRSFGVFGDYSDANKIRNVMAGADLVLLLLDTRAGMERWIARLNS